MKLDKKTGLITDMAKLPAGDLMGGREMNLRRYLLIHYTEGVTAKSSVAWWNQAQNRKNDLGAHFIIERSGLAYQCRSTNRTISHAGGPTLARWRDPKTGILYKGGNANSIGIELCNTGDACDSIHGEEQLVGYAGTGQAKHRNESKVKTWEKYSEEQIHTLILLSRVLVEAYNLDDVTGHDCVAPERKIDPGPLFPMQRVREACGFKGLPVVHQAWEK